MLRSVICYYYNHNPMLMYSFKR